MVHTLTKAKRLILEEMYPAGSRVQLEYMEPDPYSKLKPGDMGTVQMIDDAGGSVSYTHLIKSKKSYIRQKRNGCALKMLLMPL